MDENTLEKFNNYLNNIVQYIEEESDFQLLDNSDMLNSALLGYKIGSLEPLKDEIVEKFKGVAHIVKKNDIEIKLLNPIDIIKLRRFLELVKVDFKYDDGILRFDGILFDILEHFGCVEKKNENNIV